MMVLFMIAQSQKHIKHNGKNNNNTPQALAITGNNTTGIACFECMLHNIMLSDDGQLSTTIFFKNVYYLQYLAIFKVCIYGKTVGFFFCTFPELKLWTNTNNKSCLPEPLQYPSCQRNVHSTLLCKNSLQTWIKATCLTRVHHEFHWKALFFSLLIDITS